MGNMARKKIQKITFISILVATISLGNLFKADAADKEYRRLVPLDISILSEWFTAEGKYPYGSMKRGRYGERMSVITEEEAQGILRDYFPDKHFKIGKIKRKKFYFEADIRDRQGRLIDRVIIDRRTGRIRSIY
jgi:hypothetical protein